MSTLLDQRKTLKQNDIYKHIQIDDYSATPKYVQLANSILKAMGEGRIQINDTLPSINELSFEFEISRDTVEKCYKYLKKTGILSSVPGKGYFINSIAIGNKLKVFLLFNKLSGHKKLIYDAFAEALGEQATIDFYIYNNDFSLFKKLLANPKDDYSYYVIIPHFTEGGENAHEIINTIPKEKLVLLDKLIPGVKGEFAAVYENFEKDIYGALENALKPLSKYNCMKIIFPEQTYFSEGILNGFKRFCHQYAFSCKVVHDIETEPIEKGEVYINLMEKDLVILIEKILAAKLKVGKDVGVISYNEIPLKKIILNGITTISTDFQMMGQRAAELILSRSRDHVEIPFTLILRDSI
ncbi:MAG: GntR family transcriptional regulator [Bacteroidia bacterium]|nr:GntR family transcriptional regulator [Bacteroidia bacterium]